MPAHFRLVLHPGPRTLKTEDPGATGIGQSWLRCLVLALVFLSQACLAQQLPEHAYPRITTKSFDDTVFDLKVAISEHNFRLTAENRIGDAIARREHIPFPRASVFSLCNLHYAQRLIEIAPDYLLRMPCRIAVRRSAQGHTTIAAQLLPEDDPATGSIAMEINRILRAIVDEASE